MARYRDDIDNERNYPDRGERFDRERPWNYNNPLGEDRVSRDYRTDRFGRGRFGERADYDYDERRYGDQFDRYRESDYERPYERDPGLGRQERYVTARSRLRSRDIMTRELVVAVADTPLVEVASMMKEEDTGVIPVVEYQASGNGGERLGPGGSYGYGKLVGLITDRDIVLRAVAGDKDGRTIRAGEVMSTDILTAKPNERVVDILKKMADKQVRRIPVVSENGSLRGMISMADIALETDADRELAEALEEISKESSFWRRIFS